MTSNLEPASLKGQEMTNDLKSWVMVALTFIFVLLYVVALAGYLKPLDKPDMLTRLEPIIFVIIGYYFGRLPAQQNEKTLKHEINRQLQKADAAQHAKEQAQQVCEATEEKLKNVKAVLTFSSPRVFPGSFSETVNKSNNTIKDEQLRHSVISALNVLDS